MYGIYVRATSGIDYAKALVGGYKAYESRTRDVFKSLDLPQEVAVIRTRSGHQPEIVGYITLEPGFHVSREEFRKLWAGHLVPPGSRFDSDDRGKWLYKATSWRELATPQQVPDHINHGRSFTEFVN